MITRVVLCMVLSLSLAACAGPLTPPFGHARSATPTQTPRARHARTPRPTRTPEPTTAPTEFFSATPEVPPSLTPGALLSLPPAASATALLGSPAPTPLPPLALNCKLLWQSPPNHSLYYLVNKFSVGWNIKNTGTVTWEPGTFEFMYVGGARLAFDDRLPLDHSVSPGQTIVLSVPMRAPKYRGSYTTYWGILHGDTSFCRLSLTIFVTP